MINQLVVVEIVGSITVTQDIEKRVDTGIGVTLIVVDDPLLRKGPDDLHHTSAAREHAHQNVNGIANEDSRTSRRRTDVVEHRIGRRYKQIARHNGQRAVVDLQAHFPIKAKQKQQTVDHNTLAQRRIITQREKGQNSNCRHTQPDAPTP